MIVEKKADKYNLFIIEISGEFYIYRKHQGSKMYK